MSRVLVVLSSYWLRVATVEDYTSSFGAFSKNEIHYIDQADFNAHPEVVNLFDAVVIFFTVRLPFSALHSHSLFELKKYSGIKAIFLQDEYERTKESWDFVRWAQFDIVFSSIGGEAVTRRIYPQDGEQKIAIEHVLTGYFWPPTMSEAGSLFSPKMPSQKSIHMVYRGRTLPERYGSLGALKRTVPLALREALHASNMLCDIEIDDQKRLYGKKWSRFLESGRSTLVLPSGSSVFDLDGNLENRLEAAKVGKSVDASQALAEHQIPEFRGVIPPRAFEAILAGTCLVGLEGWYSGILEENTHYIPVRTDMSNLSEVLDKLTDSGLIDRIWKRSYSDIILNPRHSYKGLVNQFDLALGEAIISKNSRAHSSGAPFVSPPVGVMSHSDIRGDKTFSITIRVLRLALLLSLTIVKMLIPRSTLRRLKREIFP